MGGNSTLSRFLLQDVRQLVVAVKQLHELLKVAFTVTQKGKYIIKKCPELGYTIILAKESGRLLPVVGFDEVILHKDLIHSHHQNCIDVVLHPNTRPHGELCGLVLINTHDSMQVRNTRKRTTDSKRENVHYLIPKRQAEDTCSSASFFHNS